MQEAGQGLFPIKQVGSLYVLPRLALGSQLRENTFNFDQITDSSSILHEPYWEEREEGPEWGASLGLDHKLNHLWFSLSDIWGLQGCFKCLVTWIWANFRDSGGQRSLACYSPGGRRELDTTERLTTTNKSWWDDILLDLPLPSDVTPHPQDMTEALWTLIKKMETKPKNLGIIPSVVRKISSIIYSVRKVRTVPGCLPVFL